MRFLAASDIHIGRIPSLPAAHPDASGRGAWEAVVRCAVDRGVDALLLLGDVVQAETAYFEGYGPLRKGLATLAEKSIPVFTVAGNHDPSVFQRIAGEAQGLTLLGAGGVWESVPFKGLTLCGWSFPDKHVARSPLEDFQAPAGVPWLGLLHCDLDGPPGSRYAPVASAELERTGGDWLLGHIHQAGPRRYPRARYCGSPFALDAGEEGRHGAWLLDIEPGGLPNWEWVQLSPWTFTTLDVDLDGTDTLEAAKERIAAALLAAAAREAGTGRGHLFCSLVLRGRCALAGRLGALLQEGSDGIAALEASHGGVFASVTPRIADLTRPLIDLADLAAQRGPKGSLARLIRQAQDPASPLDELPGLLEEVAQLCQDPDLPDLDPRDVLLQAATRLLQAAADQEKAV